MKTYTMTMPYNLEERKNILEELQRLGAKDIGWDFELIFHLDETKEKELVEFCVKHSLNLRRY